MRREIRSFFATLARVPHWYLWQLRLAWRYSRGRLFIFRDAPDWVVKSIVIHWASRSDPDVVAVHEQAFTEFILRMRERARRAREAVR